MRDLALVRCADRRPDEGEGAALRAAIRDEPRISWEGALDPVAVPERMTAASVYVLPSLREPYPMSVLEAMAVGLPVVVCDDCGLASLVQETRSGIVTDPTVSALSAAVESILADWSVARAMGERGRETARTRLSMRGVGDRLLETYTTIKGAR